MKKIFSIILAIMMILAVTAQGVFAYHGGGHGNGHGGGHNGNGHNTGCVNNGSHHHNNNQCTNGTNCPYRIGKAKNLKLNNSNDCVNITFKKGSNSKKSIIYRSTTKNSGFRKIKTTAKNSFTNENVEAGEKYYYKVRSYKKVDGKKVFGKYSKTRFVKCY